MSAKSRAPERAQRAQQDVPFRPQYAVPPGETLLETLEVLGMSQAELAERAGRPLKTINEIVNGKAAITPDTAIQLERVLGTPASFWNNRERNYQATLARLKERERLKGEVDWLKKIPSRELVKRKVIPDVGDKIDLLVEVLKFFGVASPQTWEQHWASPQAAYRHSPAFESAPGAMAAWLRLGELEAQKIDCAPYDKARFGAILQEVRALTVEPIESAQEALVSRCAGAGVAVTFIPELRKTHVSGATRWLTPQKALLQLSLRHKTDDHLWFAFFHEACHILRHGKKEVFVEGKVCADEDEKEREANEFAANLLVPRARFREFVATGQFDQPAIRAFAQDLGIAPGIVVGQLQHEGVIPFSQHNDLKRRYKWVEDDAEPAA